VSWSAEMGPLAIIEDSFFRVSHRALARARTAEHRRLARVAESLREAA